jgi:hypothetical protein
MILPQPFIVASNQLNSNGGDAMLNPREQARYPVFQKILMMSEGDFQFVKRVVECIVSRICENEETMEEVYKPECVEIRRKRTMTAAEIAGKMAHSKTSTETIIQNKREEVELEERKFKEHFE